MSDELAAAISDLEDERATELVQQRLGRGDDAAAILASCQDGMIQVGKRYEAGEYFISDLMMAGEIFKKATASLGPRIKTGGAGGVGSLSEP